MNNTFRYTLVPVILGTGMAARRLADRWLWRFRVRTYVLHERYHPLLLSPSIRYRRVSGRDSYADFILHDLLRIAELHPERLLVLLGTTPFYRGLIRENRTLLERYFILADDELSFLDTAACAGGERT